MDVREKLVELLKTIPQVNSAKAAVYGYNYVFGCAADYLISNGVTVREWYSASNAPKEDGTYLVQTSTGTITTARFYAFKSFPATKHLPSCHRSPSWQSNRNVVKWTFLPQPPKGE